jgi:uncharacterized RDD family membrane protein YckC
MENNLKYSGFWLRVGAYFIDWIILSIANTIVQFILGAMSANSISSVKELDQNLLAQVAVVLPFLLASIIVSWLYYALMESSKYQGTLGKMALGIKVTDLNGQKISFGRATGRYFAKILSTLTLSIGYIMVAFTEKKQGLHDLIAKTLVINK